MENIRNVMIVDDSEEDLLIYKNYIELISDEYEYIVHAVKNGPDALQVSISSPIDCAFIDYSMPSMNGLALVESLEKISIKKFPVIILSGLPNDALNEIVKEKANLEYVQKGQVNTSDEIKKIIDGMINDAGDD